METTTPPAPTSDVTFPELRDCTRCDGEQHLLAAHAGMGKYRCQRCAMIVGFDVDADPAEFLLDRGQARLYTRDVFGPVLMGVERRI